MNKIKIFFQQKPLFWMSFGFALFYWIMESVRDVIVFEKGPLLSRVFFPDFDSLWMRVMVVSLLIGYGVIAETLSVRQKKRSLESEKKFRVGGMLWAGLGFSILYWLLETFRDFWVFEKGSFFECLLVGDWMSFTMRLMAISIILLFSAYSQNLIDDRRRAEYELEITRTKLEKEVEDRTAMLRQSNQLLKQEIDERQKVEDALELSQKSFHNIVERVTYGLLIVDHQNVIHFVNPAAETIFGCDSESLIGETFQYPLKVGSLTEIDILHDTNTPGIGELLVIETEWNGEKAFLASVQDVTERKNLETHKEEFVSNVSHELRTPMTSIRESIALISEGLLGPTTGKMDKVISICIRNIDRLRRLIDDLLDISKIEAKKIQLRRERVDLVELLQGVITTFTAQIQSRQLKLKSKFPEDKLMAYIDHDKIIQVFNNLIGNALKFTLSGYIEVSVEAEKGYIICSVQDTGKGIETTDLPKIFNKFQQFGVEVGPGDKGTGLGLAITKSIIELHGGKIWVMSDPGRGTKFSFTIPNVTEDEILYAKIQEQMDRSKNDQKPFHVIRVRIENYDQVKKQSGQKVIKDIFFKLMQMIDHIFRQAVFMTIRQDCELIAILDGPGKHIADLYPTLKRVIKDVVFESNNGFEVDFSYGWITCKDEFEDPKEVLKITQENQVHDKQERLKKYIMLVDDQPEITEIMKAKLAQLGYQDVAEVHNGQSVLKQLKKRIPDLMILDMQMPDMSGYEVIGRLNEQMETKDIPITILSAYEVDPKKFQNDFNKKSILTMRKPIEDETLQKMLYFML